MPQASQSAPLQGVPLAQRIARERFSVQATGLSETAPYYLVAALFDPFVLLSPRKEVRLHLDLTSERSPGGLAGLNVAGVFEPQKERIVFASARAGERVLHLPTPYVRMSASEEWRVLATCAELPGVVARPDEAAFAFEPFQVIARHLDMDEPDLTADVIDLVVRAVLAARREDPELNSDDRRRDFHALGISYALVEELYSRFEEPLAPDDFFAAVQEAAQHQQEGRGADARAGLSSCFQMLAEARKKLFASPIYIMDMPHGGIQFEREGYAEYDWPEAAAKVLLMYLDWTERFGYRFAPDIGAGTLKNLAATHPKTVQALREAWDQGRIEFVNGTWSQPYLQLWDVWSQRKQFEEGLEVFEELFGRRPTTYAAQEIALHPGLPGLLREFGYENAINRSQNLGTTPLDDAPMIDWEGHDGTTIPTLPAHAPRSEKMGSAIYRNLPRLLKDTADAGLPFAAITNLIDQTFVGAYKEEVVRAGRLCDLWGRFLTPSEFFKATEGTARTPRRYTLDEYDYDLEMPSNNYHRYESGGFSSLIEHWGQVSRDLQREEQGDADGEELIRLLEGQSHDGYVVSYFKRGAFLDLYMTDYAGPRYRVTGDNPRGVDHYLRDCLQVPKTMSAELPVTLEEAEIEGNVIASADTRFTIDPHTGQVSEINGDPVQLGLLKYRGAAIACEGCCAEKGGIVVDGTLSGFGAVRIIYGASAGRLYCKVEAEPTMWRPDCRTPYWEDCVYLSHSLPKDAALLRHNSGLSEVTALSEFFSPEHVTVRARHFSLILGHGGNIFFKRSRDELRNRLWAYNEISDSFWWSVSVSSA